MLLPSWSFAYSKCVFDIVLDCSDMEEACMCSAGVPMMRVGNAACGRLLHWTAVPYAPYVSSANEPASQDAKCEWCSRNSWRKCANSRRQMARTDNLCGAGLKRVQTASQTELLAFQWRDSVNSVSRPLILCSEGDLGYRFNSGGALRGL